MRVVVETVVGSLLCVGLLFAVDCLPTLKQKLAQSVASADQAPGNCSAKAAPLLLCGSVTRDGKHECAICAERACYTTTQVYCAKSCDDQACVRRPQ